MGWIWGWVTCPAWLPLRSKALLQPWGTTSSNPRDGFQSKVTVASKCKAFAYKPPLTVSQKQRIALNENNTNLSFFLFSNKCQYNHIKEKKLYKRKTKSSCHPAPLIQLPPSFGCFSFQSFIVFFYLTWLYEHLRIFLCCLFYLAL